MSLVIIEVRSASARTNPWRVLLQHSIILQCYLCAALLCCERYIFHSQVWYRALSWRDACVQCLGIILIPKATLVPNFFIFVASTAELAHA